MRSFLTCTIQKILFHDKIKDEMGGHVERIGMTRNAYSILLQNLKGRDRQLGRPRRKWEDSFRMDHKEICSEVVDLIHQVQDRDHL
jgi:hypothetical protein